MNTEHEIIDYGRVISKLDVTIKGAKATFYLTHCCEVYMKWDGVDIEPFQVLDSRGDELAVIQKLFSLDAVDVPEGVTMWIPFEGDQDEEE